MATTKVDVNLIGATGTPGSGNFLRGDGSWQVVSSGMSFINSSDLSTASTYNFTAVDASKYDGYGFFIQNLAPSVDGAKLWCRTSTNAGGAYDASASDYSWSTSYFGTYESDQADNQIVFMGTTGGTPYGVGNAANETCSGWVWVHGPHLTGYTTVQARLSVHTGEPKVLVFDACGDRLSAADVDAVQLLFASGTMTGSITAYGIANS